MRSTIADIITEELLNPTFEITRQYLEVMEVEYDGKKPKLVHIEFDEHQKEAKAYVNVKNAAFYLEFCFDTTDPIELTFVATLPLVVIVFMPTSEELTTAELLNLTTVKPTEIITKGDKSLYWNSECTYNGLVFETFPEPGMLHRKLNFILDILETDIEGIKELSRQTNTYHLFITIIHHIGNRNFTGLYIEKDIINRVSKLGLELVFDIYAEGNEIR